MAINLADLYNRQRLATTGRPSTRNLALITESQYPAHIAGGESEAERGFREETLDIQAEQSELDRLNLANISAADRSLSEKLLAEQLAAGRKGERQRLLHAAEIADIQASEAQKANIISGVSTAGMGAYAAYKMGWIPSFGAKGTTLAAPTGLTVTGAPAATKATALAAPTGLKVTAGAGGGGGAGGAGALAAAGPWAAVAAMVAFLGYKFATFGRSQRLGRVEDIYTPKFRASQEEKVKKAEAQRILPTPTRSRFNVRNLPLAA